MGDNNSGRQSGTYFCPALSGIHSSPNPAHGSGKIRLRALGSKSQRTNGGRRKIGITVSFPMGCSVFGTPNAVRGGDQNFGIVRVHHKRGGKCGAGAVETVTCRLDSNSSIGGLANPEMLNGAIPTV